MQKTIFKDCIISNELIRACELDNKLFQKPMMKGRQKQKKYSQLLNTDNIIFTNDERSINSQKIDKSIANYINNLNENPNLLNDNSNKRQNLETNNENSDVPISNKVLRIIKNSNEAELLKKQHLEKSDPSLRRNNNSRVNLSVPVLMNGNKLPHQVYFFVHIMFFFCF